MSVIDFSQPLATLLRISTHKEHELVARSPGATLMLSGGLSTDEYVRYLMMLWHIYDAFERALDRHATHPSLEPTYNPTLLARAPALAADISYLLQVPESSWKSHPAHVKLVTSMPEPLSRYVSQIEQLADSADPTPLLAHSYVRYLGDLSGGQTIRHTLAKAYGLDEGVGLGVEFYAFKSLTSPRPANQGEMKRIKEWFREGMNTAGNLGVEVKASVLQEAKVAFDLNTLLFTTIGATSDDTPAHKESGEGTVSVQPQHKANPLSHFITVAAAVFLAHFLVVSVSTGRGGCWGLLALEHSFATLLR